MQELYYKFHEIGSLEQHYLHKVDDYDSSNASDRGKFWLRISFPWHLVDRTVLYQLLGCVNFRMLLLQPRHISLKGEEGKIREGDTNFIVIHLS